MHDNTIKKSSRYPTGKLTLLQSLVLLALLGLAITAAQVLFVHSI